MRFAYGWFDQPVSAYLSQSLAIATLVRASAREASFMDRVATKSASFGQGTTFAVGGVADNQTFISMTGTNKTTFKQFRTSKNYLKVQSCLKK